MPFDPWPYIPILITLAGALVLALGPDRLPRPVAGGVLPAGLAACLLVLRRLDDLPGRQSVLFRWEPFELHQGGLALAPEATGLLLSAAVLLSLLAAALAAAGEERNLEAPGLLLLSGLLVFLWAANLVTALLGWAMMDGGLAWLVWQASPAERRARRFILALGTNILAGLALTLAAVVMAHLRSTTTLQVEALPGPTVRLLWLAGVVRLGLYPFHLWLPFRQRQTPLYLTLGVLPLVAGGYLLVRSRLLLSGSPPEEDLLRLLAGLNLVIAGLLAWRSRWWAGGSPMIIYHGAWISAAIGLGGPVGPAMALWQTLAFPPALALWAAAERARRRPLSRWTGRGVALARLAALGSLAGVPPALAFVSRWIPLRLAIQEGLFWLPAAAAVGGLLLFLSLARELAEEPAFPTRRPPTAWQHRQALLAVVLLGAPLVILSLQPLVLAARLEPILGADAPFQLADLVRGIDQRIGAVIIAVILLPVAAARELRHLGRLGDGRRTDHLEGLGRRLHLDWLYAGLWRGVLVLASALRGLMRFIEGEGFLSWILLAALLLFLLLR